MKFEWDAAKAAANQAKHGVLFEEAQSVFNDSLAVILDDAEHSQSESRELILGMLSAKSAVDCQLYRACWYDPYYQRTPRHPKRT